MLPSSKRIPRDSLKPILDSGVVFHSTFFLLRTKRAAHKAFAVLVSKKVAVSAVRRNKLRRRVYSLLQTRFPLLKTTSQTIISAKSGAQNLSYSVLEKEIDALLIKARLI